MKTKCSQFRYGGGVKRKRCKNGTRKHRKTGKCSYYKLTDKEIEALVKHHLPENTSSEQRKKVIAQLKNFKYSSRFRSQFFDKTGHRSMEFQDVFYQAAAQIAENNKGY